MFDKRLFSLADGVGRLVAAKVVCQWLGLVANIAFVVAMVRMLQPLFASVRPATVACLAVAVAAAIVRFAATRAAARFGTEAAERVKLALREKLFNKMLALGPSYAQRVRTADVVQSAGEGIEQIQSFFELFLPQLFYAVLAPVTLFVVLAPVDLPTAATLLVCAPLIVLIVGMVAMRASRVFKKYWGKYTDMGSTFLDDLQGLETLKTFDADARAARVMDEKAEQFRVTTMNVLQIQLRSLMAMDAVAYGGAAAGIGVAIWRFATGAMRPSGMLFGLIPLNLVPIAAVVLTILLSADFFIPLRQLGSYFHVAMNGMTSTKRIFALLDAPEPEHGSEELPEYGASGQGVGVEFDGVSYQYADAEADSAPQARRVSSQPPSERQGANVASGTDSGRSDHSDEVRYALRDVSFQARPGQVTAIVGPSGSGKSTAIRLLAGTLTGYEGGLNLCGQSFADAQPACFHIRSLTSASLTREISIVSAHSHLFAGTLRDNLLMACPDTTDDQLWQALEAAHIDDFVRAQSQGLDMRIMQDGSNLSGGQQQRIAIARVLLRQSAVYIFDEATSSVDVESETLILRTIRALADDGKTVLMVTHRMANAADADHVVVFDRGSVAEQGAHDGLIAADGTYAKLFRAQENVERVGRRGVSSVSRLDCAHHDGRDDDRDGGRCENRHETRGSQVLHASESADSAESADSSGSANSADSAMPVSKVIARLLHEVGPLRKYMAIACACGVVGHLAATFLPVFGVAALFAAAGQGKGDLIALVTTDVELLEIFFAHTISPVVIAIVTTAIYAIALLTLNPAIAIELLIAHLVIGIVLPKLFATAVGGLGSGIRKESASLDDEMLDNMRGLDEVIRFGQGPARLADIVARTRSLWARRARLSAKNGDFAGFGAVLVILFTAIAALLAIITSGAAAPLAADGMMASAQWSMSDSAPGLVAAFALLASSFGPTLALSALPANLTQTFASARRLFALMDEAPAVKENGDFLPKYHGMSMHDVVFGYGNSSDGSASEPILDGVSLDVPQRGILGIQGPSGRGKSTLLKLLMRYWDPDSGLVTLSEVPLPQVDAHHRRRLQTMMGQETYLFDGTIRENLLMACDADDSSAPPASDDVLRAALAKASALDLVDSLPKGLDTPVGELGGRLSEGERQRIGLARIFLRNASLVLFDEPTSRLDAYNESVILQSIDALAQRGSAVLLVSHRDSTMRVADHVIRM